MKKIVLIGAGNVGFHLGKRFFEKGIPVVQVFSRTLKKAGLLAHAIDTSYTTRLQHITKEADIYIIAVHDSAIEEVAASLSHLNNKLVVHTSGATPSTLIQKAHQRFGIFYPLQTFSTNRESNFEQLPICIDAVKKEDVKILEQLAKSICPNVYHITDEQRAKLHVAAVFVNNFTNHMYEIGADMLEKEQLPFDLLKPLIQETAHKILTASPSEMQTGPAKRGDQSTINRHLDYLQKFPAYRALYLQLSESIQSTKKNHSS